MIIKDSKIVVGGEEQNIAFVTRLNSDVGVTSGSLTLDAEEITFMPGDSIRIDMILLPWGVGNEEDDGTYSFTFICSPASPDDIIRVYIEQ